MNQVQKAIQLDERDPPWNLYSAIEAQGVFMSFTVFANKDQIDAPIIITKRATREEAEALADQYGREGYRDVRIEEDKVTKPPDHTPHGHKTA